MLIILFGLAGTGKNYIGKILADHYGFYFYDGDDALTIAMQQSIKTKQPFTQTMRDEFTHALIEKINDLKQHHTDIVIAQALYKEVNRQQLASAVKDARFIHVVATPETISKRLKERHTDVDDTYADTIRHAFEEPPSSVFRLQNEGDRTDIIKQLDQYLTSY